jgi:hypothetical protein
MDRQTANNRVGLARTKTNSAFAAAPALCRCRSLPSVGGQSSFDRSTNRDKKIAPRVRGIIVGKNSDPGVPAMSRKDELLEMARLLRAQADAMSRDAKQAFRKMADDYKQEADKLSGPAAPDMVVGSKKPRPPKSAA